MTYIPTIGSSRIASDAVTSAKILDGTITDSDVASANKDGVAGTASLRTLGTGAQQAMAGNTRLDTIAAPTGSVSLNSQKITNLADPTLAQDAATKSYVDGVASGLDIKASVRAATTANITLSGAQTIDGVSVVAGNRVLVKDQSTAADNGIYVAAAGAWSRATDADASAEVTAGMFTFVEEGTINGDTGWVLTTNDPITLGSTSLAFSQFSSAVVVSTLDSLSDVDTTGVVDGALLRYESSGTQWNDTASLLFDDNGQLKVTTTGSSAGIMLGGDAQWYRSNADELRTPDAMVVDGVSTLTGKASHGGGVNYKTATKTANYTVALATDHTILVDSSGGAVTITLPASHTLGDEVIVKDSGGAAATNNIIVDPADADTIDGASTYTINNNYEGVTLRSNGTNWFII